ncbi:MAG: RNA polymerase sigma factor [Desulfocapsaceae bacterium]|nr:RNA polymerase sigma factor [Desulfocapsaceae bacterium]
MNRASEESDEALVSAIVAGNTEMFKELLQRYQSYIFAIVYKHVPASQIEDVAQEISLQMYRSLKTYRPNGNFKSWLSTIAIRGCYDFLRKFYRKSEIMLTDLSENHFQWLEKLMASESGEKFKQYQRAKEARELLDMVLFTLSPEDQMVLKLLHFEGYTTTETAELLGWTTANVKIRAFRSRKKLHKQLKKLLAIEQGVAV